jgi:hypothetical protein
MDGPTGKLNLKTFSTKLQAYEALYWFNRSIEATLESLDGLERLGLLRAEDLNEHKIRIEHTRAQAELLLLLFWFAVLLRRCENRLPARSESYL